MATITRFEDLEIWQEARKLFNIIKNVAIETDLKTDFKLKDQIKGTSGSVMDNIAEGFERDGNLTISFNCQRLSWRSQVTII